MTFLRGCFLALLFLIVPPLHAAQSDADWLYRGSDIPRDAAWTFGTLPNGVRYAVRRNALPAGQVSIRVRIGTGALNEEDHEGGWAHFVEHMLFRGSKSFGDREARHIWQQLGASFGSDTNATTDSTQTVYQLDLPKADRASVDRSLHILSEMVDTALFEPASVDAERKIVLAEKGRRPELSVRLDEVSRPLFYSGLKYEKRDTIGTDATLAAATPAGLRAFYERWYRPDNATVIMVGDADPKMMEELIKARFGDWKPTGPAAPKPDYGRIANPKGNVATLAYPGAPYHAMLMWLQPYQARLHTKAREETDLAQSLAIRILNRRLEARARGEAPFVSASVSATRAVNIARTTQLAVTARESHWREALIESHAILASALAAPPSQAEIDRELIDLRINATSAVEGEPTVRSPRRAQSMVDAVDGGNVVTTAANTLALLDAFKPHLTPARLAKEMRSLFAGAGPRMAILSPTEIQGGIPAAEAALAAARKAAPAVRQADRLVSFEDLPKPGPAGKEVSRRAIADLGVTIVQFSNGSTLTFKQTDFEKGSVGVQIRFGNGLSGLSPDDRSPTWAAGLVAPSGIAGLDLDALERLLTGRRIAMNFGMAEDAFELRGQTNGTDLADQLRLIAAKIAYPRWDATLFNRYKTSLIESYDLAFSSATSRAGREFPLFIHGGDRRWAPVEKEDVARTQPADVERFFDPLLRTGPIETIIVGDVDIETAVAAVARTIGALPPRPDAPGAKAVETVKPPRVDPQPVAFTHNGDRNQAYATIGWTTFGGTQRMRERRALALAANMFQARLFDRLREVEGATYSPRASGGGSDLFPGWGVFYAAAEVRPESTKAFFTAAREIVADLAAKPVAADEFERVQNPIVSGVDRQLKTNAYWLSTLENWVRQPELIDQTRTIRADYAGLSAVEVQQAVARYVAEQGDWSMLVLPANMKGSGQ